MHHFLFSLLCLVVFHQLQLCLVTPVFLSSPHASLRSHSSQSEESCVKGEELKQLASAQYKMGTSLNYGSYKTTAAEPEYEIVELNSSPLTIGQTWALHFKWNEPEWTLGFGTITAANMLTPDSQNISSLAHLRFFGVNTDVGLYIISHSASNWVCFAFVLCLFQFSYHTFPHCFLTSFHLHYFSFSIFSCSISFSTFVTLLFPTRSYFFTSLLYVSPFLSFSTSPNLLFPSLLSSLNLLSLALFPLLLTSLINYILSPTPPLPDCRL